MTITPDDKNWTWVLERTCPECGFGAGTVSPHEIGQRVRAAATEWELVLLRPDARNRPRPDVWSPLEYACHVRDVFRVYDRRLQRMLDEDNPGFQNWDQDETAISERYDRQDPPRVSVELSADGDVIANRFDTVSGDQWRRRGDRSDGSAFTIDSLGRYFIHDVLHHLWDVRVP